MQDIAPLFQIVIVIAAVITPTLLVVRVLGGDEPVSLARLLYSPDDRAWPRGVQEEEPIHFAFGATSA